MELTKIIAFRKNTLLFPILLPFLLILILFSCVDSADNGKLEIGGMIENNGIKLPSTNWLTECKQ